MPSDSSRTQTSDVSANMQHINSSRLRANEGSSNKKHIDSSKSQGFQFPVSKFYIVNIGFCLVTLCGLNVFFLLVLMSLVFLLLLLKAPPKVQILPKGAPKLSEPSNEQLLWKQLQVHFQSYRSAFE